MFQIPRLVVQHSVLQAYPMRFRQDNVIPSALVLMRARSACIPAYFVLHLELPAKACLCSALDVLLDSLCMDT